MADSEHESSILYWDSCVLKYLITIIDVVVLPYLVHTSATYFSSSSSSAVVTSSLSDQTILYVYMQCYSCNTTELSASLVHCVSTS